VISGGRLGAAHGHAGCPGGWRGGGRQPLAWAEPLIFGPDSHQGWGNPAKP